MAYPREGRHAGGRPTILTPELQGEIVKCLEVGLPVRLACEYVGIGEATFYRWQAEIREFGEAVRRARIGGACEMLEVVRKAAVTTDDWRAAAEALRLAFPADFAKRYRTVELKEHERRQLAEEIADAIGGELIAALEGVGLTDEQHDAVRERIAATIERGPAA